LRDIGFIVIKGALCRVKRYLYPTCACWKDISIDY
jgi:hypothetical protein